MIKFLNKKGKMMLRGLLLAAVVLAGGSLVSGEVRADDPLTPQGRAKETISDISKYMYNQSETDIYWTKNDWYTDPSGTHKLTGSAVAYLTDYWTAIGEFDGKEDDFEIDLCDAEGNVVATLTDDEYNFSLGYKDGSPRYLRAPYARVTVGTLYIAAPAIAYETAENGTLTVKSGEKVLGTLAGTKATTKGEWNEGVGANSMASAVFVEGTDPKELVLIMDSDVNARNGKYADVGVAIKDFKTSGGPVLVKRTISWADSAPTTSYGLDYGSDVYRITDENNFTNNKAGEPIGRGYNITTSNQSDAADYGLKAHEGRRLRIEMYNIATDEIFDEFSIRDVYADSDNFTNKTLTTAPIKVVHGYKKVTTYEPNTDNGVKIIGDDEDERYYGLLHYALTPQGSDAVKLQHQFAWDEISISADIPLMEDATVFQHPITFTGTGVGDGEFRTITVAAGKTFTIQHGTFKKIKFATADETAKVIISEGTFDYEPEDAFIDPNSEKTDNGDGTWSVGKKPAEPKVTKIPTVVDSTTIPYDGADHDIIKDVGEVEDDEEQEIQYALGTKDGPTGVFTPLKPVIKDTGTYYLWYRAITKTGKLPTEPVVVKRGEEDGSVVIQPAPLEIIPDAGQSKEYGDNDPVLTFKPKDGDLKGSDTIAVVTGKLKREGAENVGTYNIVNDNLKADNYTITVTGGEGKFEIKPKSLKGATVKLSPASFEYTGNSQGPKIEVTVGTANLTEDKDYTVGGTKTATGDSSKETSYTVTITGKNNYTGDASATWKITPKGNPTVTPPSAKSLTYTASDQELIKGGSANGGTMQYSTGTSSSAGTSWSTSIPKGKDAGTYYVWYKVVGDSTHNSTDPVKLEVKIDRAKIYSKYITISPSSYNYDGTTKTPTVTVKVDGNTLKKSTDNGKTGDYVIDSKSNTSEKGVSGSKKTYSIIIEGVNNYQNSAEGTWTISGNAASSSSSEDKEPTSSAASKEDKDEEEDEEEEEDDKENEESSEAESSEESEDEEEEEEERDIDVVIPGISEEAIETLAGSVTLSNEDDALKAILGEATIKAMKKEGKKPTALLEVEALSTITREEKQITESEIRKNSEKIPNLKVGAYLDITLSYEVDGETESVSKTKTPVRFMLDMPDEFTAVSGEFFLLRIHDGAATLLPDLDNDPATLTVESDRFSTYTLLYSAKGGAVPAGGMDGLIAGLGGIKTAIFVAFILITEAFAIAIFLLVYFVMNHKMDGNLKSDSSVKVIYADDDFKYDAGFVERDEDYADQDYDDYGDGYGGSGNYDNDGYDDYDGYYDDYDYDDEDQ